MSLNIQDTNYGIPPLIHAIQKAFEVKNGVKTEICRDECCTIIFKRSIKGLVIIACVTGACTFINVAKRYAKDNETLFIACASATVITYSALDIWAYLTWSRISPEPPINIPYNERSSLNKCRFIAIKTSTLVGGVIAQLALAYIAYKDNRNSPASFALLLFAASGIPALSLLLFSRSLNPVCLSDDEKKLLKVQNQLCSLVGNKTFHFLKRNKQEQLNLLQKLIDKKNYKDHEVLNNIVRELFMPIETADGALNNQTRSGQRLYSFGEGTAKVMGALSAAARLWLFGAIAYQAGSSISSGDHEGLGIAAATLVVTTTSHITFRVLTNTATRTYKSVVAIFQGQSSPSLASILHPYFSILKSGPNALFSVLTMLPLMDLPKDYLHVSEPYVLADQIGFGIGTFLLYINALNDLSDRLLTNPKWTDDEGQLLINLFDGFSLLEETIKKSSLLNIALFLNFLPKDVFEKALNTLNLSKLEIKRYIDDNIPDKTTMLETFPLI